MNVGVLMFTVALLSETVSEFTDDRGLKVWVKPESSVHPTAGLYFFCNRKKLLVGFAVGANHDGKSLILLNWGFDDEDKQQQTVFKARDAVGVYIPAWWEFLERALGADRLAVRVAGKSAMRFDLAGARDDLENFARQCRG